MLQALGWGCRPWGGVGRMRPGVLQYHLVSTDIYRQHGLADDFDVGCGGGACCWQGVDMASLRNESRATQELLSM